jgi:hypothetical protein
MSKTKRCFFFSKRKCALERGNCAIEKKLLWLEEEREIKEFILMDISQLDEDGQEYVRRCKKAILEGQNDNP